ncbi:MAG: hypothetical protein LT106_03105 [Burkholderiaceae bacterium]|nr:hypothetical protein [Burkholderiaceae bacterium]
MGWNDHMDDSDDVSNLPAEAWGNTFNVGGTFDPNDNWLRSAEREDQVIAMRGWFRARFCDPAYETPYNGREGGYLFVDGGPFDPSTELHDRFGGVVEDELIDEVVDEMVCEVGDQWAPIRRNPPDDYDERFDLELVDADEPLRRVRKRLAECRHVLDLHGGTEAVALARRLVLGAVIGVLESFLWELAQHWIESSEEALRGCVTKLPAIRDQTIKLGDVFDRHDSIRDHVKGHLQNTVWHRWDKVVAIYRNGLGINLPSVKVFDDALVKRHDIVHRSGRTKDGEDVDVTSAEIEALSQAVERFAAAVSESANKRFQQQPNI